MAAVSIPAGFQAIRRISPDGAVHIDLLDASRTKGSVHVDVDIHTGDVPLRDERNNTGRGQADRDS